MLTGHIEIDRKTNDDVNKAMAATESVGMRVAAMDEGLLYLGSKSLSLDDTVELANEIAATGLKAELHHVDEDTKTKRVFTILCKTVACYMEETYLVPDRQINARLVKDESIFQCLLGHEHMRQTSKLQDAYRRD